MIEIQLTQGQVALVDDIDADLAQYKWCAVLNKDYIGGGKYVVQRRTSVASGLKIELLHRVILSRILGRGLTRNELTDHEDLDTLNCQRYNLRLATHSQNHANEGIRSTNTSGYKGVSKSGNGWRSYIVQDYKQKSLGSYNTPEAAARAYDKAAREIYGEFARTNFMESE